MESKVWTGREMVKMLGEEPAHITSFALILYQVCFVFVISGWIAFVLSQKLDIFDFSNNYNTVYRLL